jgi:NCAIR mutase (PurE)-related protein
LLEGVRSGNTLVEDAARELKRLPFIDLGYAKVDHHRALRSGYPEVVFCQGKATSHIVGIVQELLRESPNLLATRASREVFEAVAEIAPDAEYNPLARTIAVRRNPAEPKGRAICVISAGTADLPVAEEARVTAELLGNQVDALYDVGVAGIHRLFANAARIEEAGVLVVVAGMEGALASVIGGIADKPIVAVPTSVGYGASFGGLAALLAMLNSCAGGIGVVNIDNGFGAGVLASRINHMNLCVHPPSAGHGGGAQ